MAVTYGFFDAVYDSGTGTYDRTYTAEQMSMYFKGLISDGVVANVGNMLQVTPSEGMTVQVGSGRMIIDSRWLNNDSAYDVTIETAHATLPRKDIIFVRLDYSNRRIEIAYKKGTAAASPTPPVINNYPETWRDMGLAVIDVPAGATSITAANITDLRPDESTCGFVTGLVDHIDTAGMWEQLQASFEDWFDIMKDQLTDDAAGNLQTQIDETNSQVRGVTQRLNSIDHRILGINTTLTFLTGTQNQSISNEDFNEMITAGFYQCGALNTMQNAPYSNGYGILEVVRARSYVMQKFTYMALSNGYYVFVRASVDKGQTWRPWKRLVINS